MKLTNICLFVFAIKCVGILGNLLIGDKKTFVFSGDSNLNSKFSKGNLQEGVKNDVAKIIEMKEKEKHANVELKDAVKKTVEEIKKENQLKDLPKSGVTEEEETEVKKESNFLADDLEEAAQNFASTTQPDESEDREAEIKNIKKYQAEVINAMSHEGPYQKIDTEEIEKIGHMSEDTDDICLQDFSVPCPVHFFRTSTGCVPTKSYEGPCKKIQDKLPVLHDHQKESWGEICEASWPCVPIECPYGVDYNSICPIGWNDVGKKVCSSTYENENCPYDINFSKSTVEEKQKIAKECKLRWKCKSVHYITNFDSVCPLNWKEIGDHKCKAPDNYEGDCPKISNLKKYNTEKLKKQIEIACLVNWPYTVHVNEYQRDYDSVCPIGWSLTKSGKCKGPENYVKDSNCSDEVDFANMTSSQKESHSTACKVDFPFKDRKDCKRDFSFDCPMGWVPSEKKGFCKAPLNYKSNLCNSFAPYQNLSDSHRYYYLNKCEIDWPCLGEINNSLIYTQIPIRYNGRTNIRQAHRGPVDPETGSIIM